MVRRYILALAVLGVFFVVAAGSSQAGWGYHSESSHPGESMSSESTTPAPEETPRAYDEPREGSMESSEYDKEKAVETGRLPEGERFENNAIFGDDVERQLREGIVTGGP
jgi:hypothetical protein